jgi:hypothetical protein
MYENIFFIFALANVIFTFIIAMLMNNKINELEECYNDLYNKIKSDEE